MGDLFKVQEKGTLKTKVNVMCVYMANNFIQYSFIGMSSFKINVPTKHFTNSVRS